MPIINIIIIAQYTEEPLIENKIVLSGTAMGILCGKVCVMWVPSEDLLFGGSSVIPAEGGSVGSSHDVVF